MNRLSQMKKIRPGYEKQTGKERHRSCRMKLNREKANFFGVAFFIFPNLCE